MAQYLFKQQNMQYLLNWVHHHSEQTFAFLTGSTTSFVIVNTIGMTILNGLIIAFISGIIGGFFGWLFKNIVTPFLDKKLKKLKSKHK